MSVSASGCVWYEAEEKEKKKKKKKRETDSIGILPSAPHPDTLPLNKIFTLITCYLEAQLNHYPHYLTFALSLPFMQSLPSLSLSPLSSSFTYYCFVPPYHTTNPFLSLYPPLHPLPPLNIASYLCGTISKANTSSRHSVSTVIKETKKGNMCPFTANPHQAAPHRPPTPSSPLAPLHHLLSK